MAQPRPRVASSSHPLDFTWIGTKLKRSKSKTSRLWFQNINGIKSAKNFACYHDILSEFAKYDVEYFTFSETKRNPKNFHTIDTLKHIHQLALPCSVHALSNSTYHHNDIFINGGTLSIARGKLASRFASSGTDKYGRYFWLQFYAKFAHLRFYNIYRPVVHTDLSTGDTTVWAIQRKQLQDDNIDTDPRQHILDSLLHDINNDIKNNRLVVVSGDFNQNIFNSDLNTLFSSLGLVNVAQLFTPNTSACTFCRGSKMIDGVWVSKQVSQVILAFGYAPFRFVISSDHRGNYMDLEMFKLLDNNFPTMCPPSYRRLKSTIPAWVDSYVKSVTDKWDNHNTTLKIYQLEDFFPITGSH